MDQIAVLNSPKSSLNMQKLIAAFVVVAVGHAVVLWALSHIKPMQLRDIEPPKPIQVRFVKIVEPPKPELKKPEPPKPKPKDLPKPKKVKIVEKPMTPKKVEKIQQVKKVEPAQQVVVEQTVIKETKEVSSVVREPVKEPVKEPVQTKVDNTPRSIDANEISWKRRPVVNLPALNETERKKITGAVVVRINGDVNGNVKASVVQSCGNTKIDNIILRAVERARLNPLIINGVAVPIVAEQPFAVNIK